MKNALKSLSFLTLFGTLIFTTSCGDDDGGGDAVLDEESPVITLNAPAAGAIVAASSQVATSISISDDVEISSVSISVGNGTVSIFDLDETDIGSNSFTYNQNLSIPANVVLGAHTLDVSVTDASGNTSTASVNLEAYPVYTDGQTTVLVTSVPDQVTDYTDADAIRMVGTHQEVDGAGAWDVTSDTHRLIEYTDSEGTVTFYQQVGNTGAEFKFVRGLDWPFVQKDENGAELVGNNVIEADAQKAEFTIATWRDYNPEVANNSSGTVISIDGTLVADDFTLTGNITPAITTQSAIASSSYSVLNADETEVASGSLTLDGDGNFSETIDVSSLGLGSYSILVAATDADGNGAQEAENLSLVEFPCDDSGETAVANDKTRLIVNVPATSDDIYVTGIINGENRFGHDYPEELKMTKLSDGCYYIDLSLISTEVLENEPNDRIQIIRQNEGYADWWRGQATNTEGSDATSNYAVSSDSDGNTVKLYFAFWREEPGS